MAGNEATAPAQGQPHLIGTYKILDTLGEGGMGTVYLAEQQEPVKRRVALKLIKLGMDSKAVVARFQQERQALALMDHEGIAKVFDCGTSERGRPYFVMELVKGIPLDRFCEQQQLSLERRLVLMQQVCAAVQHAHQKGVVHRDLKPGNVLVSDDGGKLQVKIIDFGLAKAMGQRLVEATLFTEAGQVVGTPEYMAPEQADPSNQDIDTRADIWSLGVMLYQVLCGELPFPGHELRKAGMLEVQRILREVDPPKPSTRITRLGDSASRLAKARRVSVGALTKALAGDLDWVVLKALEKERNRRYETANALSMDLQRFLDHEPLVAGPPSAGYRLKKLLRRYRGQVLAGTAVVVTAIGGAIVAVDYAIVASENAKLAAANESTAKANEKLANQRAEENAKLAQQNGALAQSESAAKEQFASKVREFDQLAGVVLYERAIANEADLYPAWPHKVAAMERWLKEDAGRLLAMQPEIERTVHDLEARALPPTDEDLAAGRRSHPRFGEFDALEKRVASLRCAQAIRDGKALLLPALTKDQEELGVQALNQVAWQRVAPKPEERTVWGEEALGLAAARLAAAKATGTPQEYQILDTLAWAELANGQDAVAKQASEQAFELAPEAEAAKYDQYVRNVDAAITGAGERLQAATQELADLTAVVSERRTYRFELESQRFLHDTLAELLGKLASLAAKEKASVDQRLLWAKRIHQLSLAHPNARHTWAAVRAAIASNPRYEGRTIELRDQDITGLVPIGENPVTHLWEFYELRSAWDGRSDPAEIVIPQHDDRGSIRVMDATGLILVLLPGGSAYVGTQSTDAAGPNYDAYVDAASRLTQIQPFLLSRFEMTRDQWFRVTGQRPSFWENYRQRERVKGSGTFPVEYVTWEDADRYTRWLGLRLPTEDEWEYACRSGCGAPWSSGHRVEDLANHANLLDSTAGREWGTTPEAWTDGWLNTSPVGSFAPNGFGMCDMHGNVAEWCSGWWDPHDTTSGRSYRGGSFMSSAFLARSAFRRTPPKDRDWDLGLRPARTLTF